MYKEDLKNVVRLVQKAEEAASNGLIDETVAYAKAANDCANALGIVATIQGQLPSKEPVSE